MALWELGHAEGEDPSWAGVGRALRVGPAQLRGLRASSDVEVPRELGAFRSAPEGQGGPAAQPERVQTPWVRLYRNRLVVADVLTAAVGAAVATLIGPTPEARPSYALLTLWLVVVWPLLLLACSGYDRRFLGVTVDEYRAVTRAAIALLCLGGVAAIVLNVTVSRGYLFVLLPMLTALGLVGRRLSRFWLRRQRRMGNMMERAIIIGQNGAAVELIRTLRRCPDQGLLPV